MVFINSNPATIMTDPEVAHRTYIEPVTAQIAREVITMEARRRFCPPWVVKPRSTWRWNFPMRRAGKVWRRTDRRKAGSD